MAETATEPTTTNLPTPPAELWGLWLPRGHSNRNGGWWQHARTTPNGPLVFASKADAEKAVGQEERSLRSNEELIPCQIGVSPAALRDLLDACRAVVAANTATDLQAAILEARNAIANVEGQISGVEP